MMLRMQTAYGPEPNLFEQAPHEGAKETKEVSRFALCNLLLYKLCTFIGTIHVQI